MRTKNVVLVTHTVTLTLFSGLIWICYKKYKELLGYHPATSIGDFCKKKGCGHLLNDHTITIPTKTDKGKMVDMMYITIPLARALAAAVASPKYKGGNTNGVRVKTAGTLYKQLDDINLARFNTESTDVEGIPGTALKAEPKVFTPKAKPQSWLTIGDEDGPEQAESEQVVSQPAPKKPKRVRPPLNDSKIFLDRIKLLVNNLLVENPNYKTHYYRNNGGYDALLDATQKAAGYIMAEIDRMSHLVELSDDEQEMLCMMAEQGGEHHANA